MFLRHEMHTAPAGLLAEPGKYGMMRRKSCGAGGAEPVGASDGREAAERFRASAEGSFDAILMDMMMPGLDGCEATRAIRAMERPDAKAVPILAMTAQAFAEDRRRAQEAGMNDYLTKPLDAAALVRALRVWRKK